MSENSQVPFHQRRRQQFLDEAAWRFTSEWVPTHTLHDIQVALADPDLSEELRVAELTRKAREYYRLFALDYTAGASLDSLRDDLEVVVSAYVEAAQAERKYEEEGALPFFDFKHLDDYVRVLALLSLSILLHREDLIPAVHSLFKDGAPDKADALVEDLLGKYLDDRPFLDVWFHDMPFRHLLDVTANTPPDEKLADMKKYLKAWYRGMASTAWHDSHKEQSPKGVGAYTGYWAFEAAATAYLYEMDDAELDHLVFPKDLLAFARSMPRRSVAEATSQERLRLRCEAGHACPREGWWSTPAKLDSRRRFRAGETMPAIESDWGRTIWGWDLKQD
ncbi:DUF1911 domain-containing protein [Aquabacterium sp. A7-Y]|uniref:PoNe immunity protein domain-containing protein n=1 Tax=Aquabacterium sp. A7-Y TaxID=1349605 RepID=UPI00223DCDDF|nr:PoNe immunity protein domain-containing protein [Aquabacterium sp. A7-Y]MCW7538031.1 DUF1911 domain-containing protein [Aquabacterium sp. A7-Y]